MKNIAIQAKRLTEMTDRRDTNIFDTFHALRTLDISLRKIHEHILETQKINLQLPIVKGTR